MLVAFTAVCAVAFVTNLALQIVSMRAFASPLAAVLNVVLCISASLLPPLAFHLIYAKEAACLPRPRIWRFLLLVLYVASVAAAFVKGLNDTNVASGGLAEWLSAAPALILGISASLALAALFFSSRVRDSTAHHHLRWNQVLLGFMAGDAALSLAVSGPWVSLLPDYLLLTFFSVTLYYQERLIFFDLLIKRGAFFGLALLALPIILMIGFRLGGSPVDGTRAWICALILAPFWLLAPWAYRRMEAVIDRGWLRRRYSIPEAEQRFIRDVEIASTEEDLRARAAASLQEIFRAPACVSFDASTTPAVPARGLSAPLVYIAERPDAMPFLSDDLRLLQSLARTLGIVRENVLFRQREQDLRWLASRAELKALRAQMNPHFLFNALNAIAGLIEDQPRVADETIERLAHVLRYALRHSDTEWVRLDEEIEFVSAYLQVEQARFGERLRVEFDVEGATASIPVPAMTIQPLVENAIKHGISPREGPGIVGVKVALDGDLLSVAVSDNGHGFPPGFSIGAGGHGLRNVADRITGYYGGGARLTWDSGREGTRVLLKIPRNPCAS